MVAYIRMVKTALGAVAVQIVYSSRRGPRSIPAPNDLQLWKLLKERKVESGLAQETVEQAGLGSI